MQVRLYQRRCPPIIRILDRQLRPVAILENVYNIGYERKLNELWTAHFALPLDDPKNSHCKPLNYVELTDDLTGEYIGLFRIIPKQTIKNESSQEVRFQCEHVLATLLDSSLFRYHQLTNNTTTQVLQYLLNQS